MNIVDPTSAPAREIGRSPDDVDETLQAFFKKELPNPWPSFAGESASALRQPGVSMPRARWPLFRSRFMLAASVLALLLGAWWLGSRFSSTESPTGSSDSGKSIATRERPRKGAAPKIVPDGKPSKESLSPRHP